MLHAVARGAAGTVSPTGMLAPLLFPSSHAYTCTEAALLPTPPLPPPVHPSARLTDADAAFVDAHGGSQRGGALHG
eukprot:361016-Chlamydomonas_euryale.AAC.3